MENIALVIITALISGLLATLVTIWWQRRAGIFASKMRIFETLKCSIRALLTHFYTESCLLGSCAEEGFAHSSTRNCKSSHRTHFRRHSK